MRVAKGAKLEKMERTRFHCLILGDWGITALNIAERFWPEKEICGNQVEDDQGEPLWIWIPDESFLNRVG